MRSPILLFAIALLAALRVDGRELAVRAVPSWVERVDADVSLAVPRQNVRWGLFDILGDHQVRVTEQAESHYYRTVRKVLSPSGVRNASELELDFDPSYQRLTVHEVSVIRDGKRINALDAEEIRIIDKEESTSERIYDGQRTALVFIKDVRPGDVIDYSWSLDGPNPLLDGRYTDEYDLSSAVPAKQLRHRLVWPTGRPLHWRGDEPEIVTREDVQVLLWEKRDLPALDVEDSIPSWYEPWQSVQISEFASWNEVARWSEVMYGLDPRSIVAVRELAAKLRGENPTRDAQLTAAIRFVQDDIRYLGIETGRNSHEPHQPWETLAARWGDCKDKTFLLVTLLRELGIDAWPALVNTRLRHRLDDKLPSPFLFDHVIAQVILGGKTHWVDGTISDQGGSLETIETPSYGRALVLRDDTTALTKIATNEKGSIVVAQTYITTSYEEPTRLEVVTTYRGADADGMRSALASMSLDDFAVDRINDLAADQPAIEADGTPKIDDDRAKNVIVITERYKVRDLWKDGHWTWYPRDLDAHLTRPDTMIRSMPLAFEHPLQISQHVTFVFPEEIAVTKSTSATETATFRYDYVVDGNGRSVQIRQSLRSKKDVVEVKDVADHLTKLNTIWDEIGYRLSPSGAAAAPAAESSSSPVAKWLWAFLALAVFVTLCVVLATRRRRTFAPVARFAPGEAPAVALSFTSHDELTARLAGMPCRCGSRLHSHPELQSARYDERELTIVTRQCGSCGREQSVYFTAA